MLTLLIPGPKSPIKDIDVYLRPLIEELKTINDFPARSSLSGWSGQGYKACPACNKDSPSVCVLSKTAYVGRRRFLKKPHKWRSSREFNGQTDNRDHPKEFGQDEILGIPYERSPATIPRRQVAEESHPQRQVVEESSVLSLGKALNVVVLWWSRKTGNTWFFTSWKNNTDPGFGDYSLKMDIEGKMFCGTPKMKGVSIMYFEFVIDPDEIFYSFEMLNKSVYSRVIINPSGIYRRYIWVETTKSWNLFWIFPSDRCDDYGERGHFGVCDANSAPKCKCMTGFRPKDQQEWELQDGTGGCERTSDLDCRSDAFLLVNNMRFPYGSKAFIDEKMNLSGGQDLYVKVAFYDIGNSKHGSGNGNHVGMIIAFSIGGGFYVLIILLVPIYVKRRTIESLKISKTYVQGKFDILESNTLAYCFKDLLRKGEVVAIKSLSTVSDQGIEEIKNEVSSSGLSPLRAVLIIATYVASLYLGRQFISNQNTIVRKNGGGEIALRIERTRLEVTSSSMKYVIIKPSLLNPETNNLKASSNQDGIQELDTNDASKQGRRIDAIDADKDITLVSVQDDVEMFDVNDLGSDEVFVAKQNENVIEEVVDAAQDSTTATTATITTKKITLTQALEALKTSKPNATLFQELLEKRIKFFAAKRAEEKRNKPPTQAQHKKITCTYLKNIEGCKLKDLKLKEFDSIKETFDRAFRRVNTFEDFKIELVQGKEKEHEKSCTAATTATITTKKITLTQALEALKTSKPNVKGIVLQEPSESITTIPKQQSHDKGKGIMIEEPVKPKKKDQIRLDEEAAKRLQTEFDLEEILAREKAQQEQKA
nr:receptor-like serine/threonine-protein kinase SD1-8 [Tanacetum cinerariifolium]